MDSKALTLIHFNPTPTLPLVRGGSNFRIYPPFFQAGLFHSIVSQQLDSI
jgi:hypothetical protein